MAGPAPGDLIVECVEDPASIEACTGAWAELAARSLEPNVFFGPRVVVEDGVHIMANCHLVGARIGKGARVGPFARIGAFVQSSGLHVEMMQIAQESLAA